MLFLKALGKGNEELQLFASFCCDRTVHGRPNGFQQVMWCGGRIDWEVENHMLSLERCAEKPG